MYLVFDIGGTKMRLARSVDGKNFTEPIVVPTPQSFGEAVDQLKIIFTKLAADQPFKAVVGGVAGSLNKSGDRLVRAPHLADWVGKPLKLELESLLGCPVWLENDSALVGLGEATVGAGVGHNIVAYLTVSTGVGGVRLVGGQIDIHNNTFEPGHQIINFSDTTIGQCACGGFGHLESYVSGTDFVRRFGKQPHDVDSSSDIWNLHAKILACGLVNTIVHWTPDIVVLGGSMMKVPGIPLDTLRRQVAEMLTIYDQPPVIEKALLADLGGLHGALIFLRRRLGLK